MQGQVVIINFPDTGHINPTLPLVAELAERRIQVTYFLPEAFRAVVTAAGATWRPLRAPMDLSQEMLEHYLDDSEPPIEEYEFPLSTLAVASWILPDLIEELQGLSPPPGVIVYDPFLPHALVAARHLHLPAVCLVTHPGPGTMPHPPQLVEEWESHQIVQKARKEIKDFYEMDVFQHGTLMEFYSADLNLVTTIAELFAPPRLSPQLKRFGHFPFHCVGPMVNPKLKRLAHAFAPSKPVEPLPHEQIDAALAAGKRFVFVSMGTVGSGGRWNGGFGPLAAHNGIQNLTGKEFLQQVYRAVMEAFQDQEDLLVLMAVGPQPDALEGLPSCPSNVLLRPTVPQLEVLQRCHAFVTHGGNNSIHEALSYAVPMAVIPMFGDQPYNAESVAGLGCGVSFRYPLQTLTPQRLRGAVRHLLEEPSYHLAAMQLSQKLRAASGAKGAAEAIVRATSKCHLAGA
ncbi:unnamed protein product [Durusdinium trenchii]|uniref:Uncharacterized UDP-glucosyltransferase YojK n=2 Tax=Durusdinium trenchii TaxID=1381693 RepID=A0ABP0NDC6_9DINO